MNSLVNCELTVNFVHRELELISIEHLRTNQVVFFHHIYSIPWETTLKQTESIHAFI